jgi:hypothetical protein
MTKAYGLWFLASDLCLHLETLYLWSAQVTVAHSRPIDAYCDPVALGKALFFVEECLRMIAHVAKPRCAYCRKSVCLKLNTETDPLLAAVLPSIFLASFCFANSTDFGEKTRD